MKIEKLEDLPNEILGNWKEISKFQKLSEDCIRDHKDKVDWKKISQYQELSESFIKACIRWAEAHNYQMVRTVCALKIYCNGYEVYYDNTPLIDYFRFFKACDWLLGKVLSTEEIKEKI